MKPSLLAPGQFIGGRYRVVRLLGSGGMSHVYEAEDEKLRGKTWAIKQVLRRPGDRSFTDEASVLCRLNHPCLPQIVDVVPPDETGYCFLVMELIAGVTLEQHFERNGSLMAWPEAVEIAVQLSDVLDYLHTRQPQPWIYRDLKPSNVMLQENSSVKLIDFGIARSYKEGQTADTVRLGTFGYAAPEQISGGQTDSRSDLYALGALLYYFLSGGRLFAAGREPLHRWNARLPQRLEQLVHNLLAEHPNDRLQSASELKKELTAIRITAEADRSASDPSSNNAPGMLPPKLILVGGLYAGAGATFAAIAIARALHRAGIGATVVELPDGEGDLHALLDGDRRAPKGYRYAGELLNEGKSPDSQSVWRSGRTAWLPAPPSIEETGGWNPAFNIRLAYTVPSSFILVDISDRWIDPRTETLRATADACVFVTDASLWKLSRTEVMQRVSFLSKSFETGKPVYAVLNRLETRGLPAELYDMLPSPIIAALPELPADSIVQCLWSGKLVQDHQAHSSRLDKSLERLLAKLLSGQASVTAEHVRRGIFRRLL